MQGKTHPFITRFSRLIAMVAIAMFCIGGGLALSLLAPRTAYADIGSGTYDGVPWRVTDEGILEIGQEGQTYTYDYSSSRSRSGWPWVSDTSLRYQVYGVKVLGTVNGNGSHEGMFADLNRCKSLDVANLKTDNITNMAAMFYGVGSAAGEEFSVDLSSWNTENVTSMQDMFNGCSFMTSIDVSSFNTSKVTSFASMFNNITHLASLDVSNFDTSQASRFDKMFNRCKRLTTLDISNFVMKSSANTDAMLDYLENLESIKLGLQCKISGSGFGSQYSWNWSKDPDNTQVRVYTPAQLTRQYKGATMAGTYYRTDRPASFDPTPLYAANGLGDSNLWEIHDPDIKFKGYCINHDKPKPYGYYTKELITSDADLIGEFIESSESYGSQPLGSTMREALIALIYWAETDGYYDQEDIWHFTNNYNKEWGKSADGHTFADIPNHDSMKLYLYKSESGNQNLLTIEGLTKEAFGGVAVQKTSEDDVYLQGAEFTVYDASGAEVATMKSDANGVAAIYRMSAEEGLPLGTYTVKETAAPKGYTLDNQSFTFTVEQDQQMVTLNTSGDEMIFVNAEDDTYEGGGIAVSKTNVDGEGLTGAEFTIYDSTGAEVTTISSNFEGIASTGQKDLPLGSYTIKETTPPTGYKLSTETKSFELTEDGQFYLLDGERLNFVDEKKTGTWQIKLTKQVEGATKLDGYEFELKDASGAVIGTATSNAQGEVVFDAITYDTDDLGYVIYTVSEVAGSSNSIEYDDHVAEITVLIEDNGSDTLECSQVLSEADSDIFTNTYSASGSVDLKVTKELSGRNLEDEQFSFQLKDSDDNVLQTKKNDADGTVTFDTIEYSQDDVVNSPISYTISEVDAGARGYSYDDSTTEVSVELTDDGAGNITATPTYSGNSGTFSNEYEASGKIGLTATKALTGHSLAAEQFSFELKDAEGNVLQTKQNDADGKVTFDELEFDQEDLKGSDGSYATSKSFAYTISEVNAGAPGYTYDGYEASFTVTVSDNGNGTLSVSASSEADSIEFANSYEAAGSVEITGTKTLTGADLVDGQFTFLLADADGIVQETVNEGGVFTFELSYTQDDLKNDDGSYEIEKTFDYIVSELDDGQEGVTYDHTAIAVTVTVMDTGDGILDVKASYGLDPIEFTNTYEEPKKEEPKKEKTVVKKRAVPKRMVPDTGDTNSFAPILSIAAFAILYLAWNLRHRLEQM